MGAIKDKIIYYSKSEFLKNVSTIFSGNLIAQMIPFLIEPIIARIYDPADFAVLALYISIANLFSIIATGRYEMAIVLPLEERKAANVLGLSLIITVFVSVISFLVVWLFNAHISQILESDEIGRYLYFVPISVFFTGWYQSLNYWAIRKKNFKNVTYSRVTQTVTNSGLNLAFGIAKLKALGLMIAYLTGQVLAIFPLIYKFLRDDIKVVKWFSKKEMKEQAIVYKDFPKINSIHAFSDIIRQSTVVFLISSFFGDVVLGLYSRSFRLLFAPTSIIGSAIGQVFYQKASLEYKEHGNIRPLVKKTIFSLAMIAIPVFTLSMLFGDEIFAFVLGEKWRVAGEYAQILSPWVCVTFIVAPISQIPLIVGKQKTFFLLSLIGGSIIILSIVYAGVFANDIKVGFYIISALEVIYYSYLIYWIIKISK